VQIKIVDENMRQVAVGEVGELLIKGPNVMDGYYKAHAATAEVFSDGWLHSGDFVRQDEDGFLFFEGLKKRMIITSGFNVYPREVEDILGTFPGVASVVVEGKPDTMRGEIVCAQIKVKENHSVDERELLRFARRELSPYKVPREIKFFGIDK